jgi:hypothetical protein
VVGRGVHGQLAQDGLGLVLLRRLSSVMFRKIARKKFEFAGK